MRAMSTMGPIRILGIPGSLREASYNKAALRAAQELLPDGATLEVFDLEGLPAFNEDDERALPARVVELKARIREADAILIATPRVQLLGPRCLEQRHRLGLAAVRRQRLGWQAGRDHGGVARPAGDRPRAVSPAPDLRVPQHVPRESAGGHDFERGPALRRAGSARR
jgi:hypothetical protein